MHPALTVEFIDQLQPSIFSQLFAPGRATNIPVPAGAADIKIPARTPTGGSPTLHGSFVAEGNPIAVRKSSLAQVSLAPKKLGVITSYTDELANYSAQALEPLLQMIITGDTRQRSTRSCWTPRRARDTAGRPAVWCGRGDAGGAEPVTARWRPTSAL